MDSVDVDSIHLSSGSKLSFILPEIKVNHVVVRDGKIALRGSTSLLYRRKSYEIRLPEKVSFFTVDDTMHLRKFFAISMSMDRNYIRNALAFGILKEFNINVPGHCYAKLTLNGSAEGIYMIYRPPADQALRECHSPLVLRREYYGKIDNYHTRNISPYREKLILEKFRDIYERILPSRKGQILYKKLNAVLDLKEYFNWLAFDYLFMNGDYTDEVYFYWDKDLRKFRIIPWDMDDLFQNRPHEGEKLKKERIGDKLLYSSEDILDRAIASDPVLYDAYIKEFRNFLKILTPAKLQLILEGVYAGVEPCFNDPEMIRQSKYDKYGPTNITSLEKDLNTIFEKVSGRMQETENQLISMNNKKAP